MYRICETIDNEGYILISSLKHNKLTIYAVKYVHKLYISLRQIHAVGSS